jgi:hypothetical protein
MSARKPHACASSFVFFPGTGSVVRVRLRVNAQVHNMRNAILGGIPFLFGTSMSSKAKLRFVDLTILRACARDMTFMTSTPTLLKVKTPSGTSMLSRPSQVSLPFQLPPILMKLAFSLNRVVGNWRRLPWLQMLRHLRPTTRTHQGMQCLYPGDGRRPRMYRRHDGSDRFNRGGMHRLCLLQGHAAFRGNGYEGWFFCKIPYALMIL